MEQLGAMSEGEWNSLNVICSDEAEFMAQLLSNCSLPNEVPDGSNLLDSSAFWQSNGNISGIDEGIMYSSDETNTRMQSFPQNSSYESYYPSASHPVHMTNNNMITMDSNSSRIHILTTNMMEGDDFLNQDVSNDSIKSNENVSENVPCGKNSRLGAELANPTAEVWKEERVSSHSNSKKRSRAPGEVQRNKRSTKLKKSPKLDENNEDNNNSSNNAVLHRQISSSCSSEDDLNASHELNGLASSSSSKGSGALDLNGKTRASRGSATDPQSLYARKRRERINERLRILQNLVPNGTKVDISTMLEEALQYVKFLQLQIKLLSSDELWMYAPIAYNGMDIGLDLKICTPKAQS